MTLQELQDLKNRVSEEYNNLANPFWVVQRLQYLQAKFDTLGEQINEQEQQANASNNSKQRQPRTKTGAGAGQQAIPGETTQPLQAE
jgi:hypothetical protein